MDEVDGVVDNNETPKNRKRTGRPTKDAGSAASGSAASGPAASGPAASGRRAPVSWKWKVNPINVEDVHDGVVGHVITETDRAQQAKVAADTEKAKKKLDRAQVSFIFETYSFLGMML
jgi:hypothetical protein